MVAPPETPGPSRLATTATPSSTATKAIPAAKPTSAIVAAKPTAAVPAAKPPATIRSTPNLDVPLASQHSVEREESVNNDKSSSGPATIVQKEKDQDRSKPAAHSSGLLRGTRHDSTMMPTASTSGMVSIEENSSSSSGAEESCVSSVNADGKNKFLKLYHSVSNVRLFVRLQKKLRSPSVGQH